MSSARGSGIDDYGGCSVRYEEIKFVEALTRAPIFSEFTATFFSFASF